MFNRLIAWSLNNRLLVLAVAAIAFVAGGFMLQGMPKDVFPEFAPPQVVIQTEAPGLAPKDVEALITYPLESAINGTTSVDIVRSSSSVGLSTIVVVFRAGTDIYLDRQLVNERVQSVIGNLPTGTQPPVMLPVTSAVGWLVKYSLTSKTLSPMALRTFSDWVYIGDCTITAFPTNPLPLCSYFKASATQSESAIEGFRLTLSCHSRTVPECRIMALM